MGLGEVEEEEDLRAAFWREPSTWMKVKTLVGVGVAVERVWW